MGKENKINLISGSTSGEKMNRILMDENPYENQLTVRLSKEENGVLYYQDYVVSLKRELTLEDLSVKCDGVTMMLIQHDGTAGFHSLVKEYDVTVSLAAQNLALSFGTYQGGLAFGEEDLGYRVSVDGIDVTGQSTVLVELDGTFETQTILVRVENDKAPEGTGIYKINVLKSPPVLATFDTEPADALLSLYETMSGERLWPDENGQFSLCEGYSYRYTLTLNGYVGKSGILDVTRDENNALIVANGDEHYPVMELNGGGAVTIPWFLKQAPVNTSIDTGLFSPWPNFRGGNSNNAVVDYPVPTAAEEGTLYWANKIGSGIDADAVGSPIIVDGCIITYASNKIYRVDTVTGEILATGIMDHKSSFSITPPTYADGMVYVALSNGCIQAFNAVTLESMWLYTDPLGGQPNCPLVVKDGYLYTGFWNSETGNANFVCISVTDEDPTRTTEDKCNTWYYTAAGGFYWAGAYVGEDYVLVGTDDGTNRCNSNTSRLLLLDAKSGKQLDQLENLNGDIRSTVVRDEVTDAYYFTSKGGSFYSVQVTADRKLTNLWSVGLDNGYGGIPMST